MVDATHEPAQDAIVQALSTVQDPEIHLPITELGMVDRVEVDGGKVVVHLLLTISGCPLKDTLRTDVTAALMAVEHVTEVVVEMGTMNQEQRDALKRKLGGHTREIPFTLPTNTTRVLAIASGKGGVGKSSMTVNLAMALAKLGKSVGILDADIYGHSIPGLLGIEDAHPTGVHGMIMPVPVMGLKVVSMGMFKEDRRDVVAWRGPILDKAMQQMLADVVWGDLDYLLLDLPPGTGDIAMSLGQKLPGAEYVVVTTPQTAAAEVAERAGTMAALMNQRVIGVIENMSYLDFEAPDTGKHYRIDVFGAGGGAATAQAISERAGYTVPLLAEVPLEPALRANGDQGSPIVEAEPDSRAAQVIMTLATIIDGMKKSVKGKPLGLNPQA